MNAQIQVPAEIPMVEMPKPPATPLEAALMLVPVAASIIYLWCKSRIEERAALIHHIQEQNQRLLEEIVDKEDH
jgi:hypothetical protein